MYIYIHEKNIVCIGFRTICGFRHPPQVLEHIPRMKGTYCIFQVLSLPSLICRLHVYPIALTLCFLWPLLCLPSSHLRLNHHLALLCIKGSKKTCVLCGRSACFFWHQFEISITLQASLSSLHINLCADFNSAEKLFFLSPFRELIFTPLTFN